MGAICTFCPSSQNQVTVKTSMDPFPPPSNQPGLSPPPPPRGTYSTTCKDEPEAGLGRNHTSASDSRSEAADWARGGCGDHFGLFSAPVRGQGAEASAGWPARFFIALLYTISGKLGRAGTTKTHPWRSLYKESRCTFMPLSSNIWRRPHLLTHREETQSNEIRGRTLLRWFAGQNSKKDTTF